MQKGKGRKGKEIEIKWPKRTWRDSNPQINVLQANLVWKITLHPYCNRSIGPCLLGANAFLYDPVSIYIIIYVFFTIFSVALKYIYIYIYLYFLWPSNIYIYIYLYTHTAYIYIQTHIRCLDPYDADMQTWAQITGKNALIGTHLKWSLLAGRGPSASSAEHRRRDSASRSHQEVQESRVQTDWI